MKHHWRSSLQARFFWIFLILLMLVCLVLGGTYISLFTQDYFASVNGLLSDVNNLASQSQSHMVQQVDQLSVSILINSTVQKNLAEINRYQGRAWDSNEVRHLSNTISDAIKGSVFTLSDVVSLRIYSLYDEEIFVGTTDRRALENPVSSQDIYAAQGGAVWALSEDGTYLYLCRAILSTETFTPIGYMVIVVDNDDFCQALQPVSSIYNSRIYVVDPSGRIVVSNSTEAVGDKFPYDLNALPAGTGRMKDPFTGGTSAFFVAPQMDNGWTMVSLVSIEQYWDNLRQAIVLALVAVLLSAALAAGLSLLLINRMFRPARQLMATMHRFGTGELDARMTVNATDEIGKLSEAYNNMADSIQELMEKVYMLELAKKEAEIENLKMQINPHFLYNTLDTISWLGILHDNEDVSDVSVSLAKLLRANLKSDAMVTVDTEMSTIREYLQIQQYRFGDKIRVHYEIAPSVGPLYMPNFLLQPLVENSIMHGMECLDTPSDLTVSIQPRDSWLYFSVRDTGEGMTEEQVRHLRQQCEDMKSHNSIGLKNVYRRLYLLYGQESQFEIQSAPGKGTTVSFRIPITLSLTS